MMLADATTDLWGSLAHQGPWVVIMALTIAAGYKRIWGFTNQFDRELTLKDAVIEEKNAALALAAKYHEEVITIKDREFQRQVGEMEREREEKEMYRGYTFRLLEAARQQIPLVTETVVRAKEASP